MIFFVLHFIDGFWGAIVVIYVFAGIAVLSQFMHHID